LVKGFVSGHEESSVFAWIAVLGSDMISAMMKHFGEPATVLKESVMFSQNNRSFSSCCLILTLIALSSSPLLGAKTISTGTLIEDMVDLIGLAEFPDPAYQTVQFSSYDHRSQVPGTAHWFANSDGFGNEPVPNFEEVVTPPDKDGVGEYLICDVNGPGAIVRTWTAAINGTITVHLDSAEEPIYSASAQDFLLYPYHPYAQSAKLDESLFVGTLRQRNACYFPMPFEKRCRIIWRGRLRQIHFYQIQIRRYQPGTSIRTFQTDDLQRYRSTLKAVSQKLANLASWADQSPLPAIELQKDVAPQARADLLELEGPLALERLTLRVKAEHMDRALRQTVLSIFFDDHSWGQVQCPLGDFFGVAPGINPYDALPFSVEPNGDMICRFVMPFAKTCRIQVENKGDQAVSISGSVRPMTYTWNERSLHFQARWRIDHDLVADGRQVQDMPYLIAQGQGVYVGSTTILLNPNPVPTPYGNWWGEGDEKIFVDNEVTPSTFGTGSEDYYNYAWSSPDIFIFPYCAQPRNDGPANRGFVTNNRWHILDALPFHTHIAFYMELYSHERTPGVSYARIGYHYARPGLRDDHLPITHEDIRHLKLPENWQPASRMGAAKARFFQTEAIQKNTLRQAGVRAQQLWSGGQLFVWQPKHGEVLELGLNIPEPGAYVIHIVAGLSPQSGQCYATLNGETIGLGDKDTPINLNVPHRILSRNFSSRKVDLDQGLHTLTIHNASTSPKAELGLDFVWIQKK
jgi:hypothetical protein